MIYKIGYRQGGEWKYGYFLQDKINEEINIILQLENVDKISIQRKEEFKHERSNYKEPIQ